MCIKDFDRVYQNYIKLVNACRVLIKKEASTKASLIQMEASGSQTIGLIKKVSKTEKMAEMNQELHQVMHDKDLIGKGIPYIAELICNYTIPSVESIRNSKLIRMIEKFSGTGVLANKLEYDFYRKLHAVSNKIVFLKLDSAQEINKTNTQETETINENKKIII